jgi:hypothetical protein
MRVLSTKDPSAAAVLRALQLNPNVLGIMPGDAVNARVRVLTVGGRHPLREPQRYPLRTTSTRPVPEITTITAVGDIMLGRRVGDRHRADPGAPLKPLAKRLASAEITIGNFRVDSLYRGITYPGWRLLRRQSASRPGTARGRIRSTLLGRQPRRRLRGPRFTPDLVSLLQLHDRRCRSGTESGPGPQAGDCVCSEKNQGAGSRREFLEHAGTPWHVCQCGSRTAGVRCQEAVRCRWRSPGHCAGCAWRGGQRVRNRRHAADTLYRLRAEQLRRERSN